MLTFIKSAFAERGDAVTSPLKLQTAEALAKCLSDAGVSTYLMKAPRGKLQVYIPEMTAEARSILNNFTRTVKC